MSVQPNLIAIFLAEAEELLVQIEEAALALSSDPSCAEQVHQLFRAFHTIKGSSAMFALDDVAGFTHHVESALDLVRNGRVAMSPDLARQVLAARDIIKELLTASAAGQQVPSGFGQGIVEELARLCGESPSPPAAANAAPAGAPVAGAGWSIHFVPPRDMVQRGL